MKLYSRNDKDCPIQYSMYNPKICQKGIMDVAKCYQAYAKGDYQLDKTLPAGMVLYDSLNERLYRFGITYTYNNIAYVFAKVFETIPVSCDPKKSLLIYGRDVCVKSEIPIKIIQIKLSDALYFTKWQK